MYSAITDSLVEASSTVMHECKTKASQILGWNDVCKEVHQEAREAFLNWSINGKPKQGFIFDCMKRTRSHFKYVLRKCKRNDEKSKADRIARKFIGKDSKAFWKEISKYNGSDKSVIASTVNGVSGNDNIVNMWHGYYKDLLNSTDDPVTEQFVRTTFDTCKQDDFFITTLNIREAIKDLKKGKSVGLDNLSSEHFIYASDRLYGFLAMVFNTMLLHGYLPKGFMSTVLIPIVKDKKGDITDRDNYRPIAITCVASKILELIVLERCSENLNTTPNQFGFKHGLSTELCIFSLKQCIEYYRSLSSPVYLCYLDASKAFDRINHGRLFIKLMEKGVPSIVVRLFCMWYCTQEFCVQWGTALSHGFNVSNGVRQGGILSPYLFNVYIDDLSKGLASLKVGCNFNGVSVNHLVYADDTVLLGASPTALQQLINFCADYAESNEIFYNLKKTKCMCIRPKCMKNLYFPTLYLLGKPVKVVTSEKYLGAFISDDLSDDEDIIRQMRSIYARGNVLIRNFIHCTDSVKASLFKTYLSSLYGSTLWSTFKRKTFSKLKVAYNNVFRYLFRKKRGESVSASMIDLGIDPFNVIYRKFVVGFIKRVTACDNVLVRTLHDWLDFNMCPLQNHWLKIAYC